MNQYLEYAGGSSSPASFEHDDDPGHAAVASREERLRRGIASRAGGNLSMFTPSSGRSMIYHWDAENRLQSMHPEPTGSGGTPLQDDLWVSFTYDWRGRRVQKLIEAYDVSHEWYTVADLRYLYDEWNLLVEFEASGEEPFVLRRYTWGLDLAGQFGDNRNGAGRHGAGGIGGLLAMEYPNGNDDHPSDPARYIYFYDANGNVSDLIDVSMDPYEPLGATAGHYEYDPYGQSLPISISGLPDPANPFRFSTKYQDADFADAGLGVGDLYYYGYRYYSPLWGRWLSRDPLGESDAPNLHESHLSAPVLYVDALGRSVETDNIANPSDVCTHVGDVLKGKPPFTSYGRHEPLVTISVCAAGLVNGRFGTAELPIVTPAIRQAVRHALDLATLARGFSPGGNVQNTATNRFVYTCRCGFIDMGHLFNSALAAYLLGQAPAMGAGYGIEVIQQVMRDNPRIFGPDMGWGGSAWTYEDLPSDLLGVLLGGCMRRQTPALNGELAELGHLQGGELFSGVMNVIAQSQVQMDIQEMVENIFRLCGAVDTEATINGVKVKKILEEEAGKLNAENRPNYTPCPRRISRHCDLCGRFGVPKFPVNYEGQGQ